MNFLIACMAMGCLFGVGYWYVWRRKKARTVPAQIMIAVEGVQAARENIERAVHALDAARHTLPVKPCRFGRTLETDSFAPCGNTAGAGGYCSGHHVCEYEEGHCIVCRGEAPPILRYPCTCDSLSPDPCPRHHLQDKGRCPHDGGICHHQCEHEAYAGGTGCFREIRGMALGGAAWEGYPFCTCETRPGFVCRVHGDKAPTCTCDAFCDSPCPLHAEAMAEQDVRIQEHNRKVDLQATRPTRVASKKESRKANRGRKQKAPRGTRKARKRGKGTKIDHTACYRKRFVPCPDCQGSKKRTFSYFGLRNTYTETCTTCNEFGEVEA